VDVLVPVGEVELEDCAVEERIAAKAWFWVEAATFRSEAKWDRNAVISAAPISAG
jgi:hypothetical protein